LPIAYLINASTTANKRSHPPTGNHPPNERASSLIGHGGWEVFSERGVWAQNSGELQLQLRRAEGTAAIVTRKKAIQ